LILPVAGFFIERVELRATAPNSTLAAIVSDVEVGMIRGFNSSALPLATRIIAYVGIASLYTPMLA
jgi:hypothetical protein